jgi:uncharacterized membrane protein YraQ (UPF0718 family)
MGGDRIMKTFLKKYRAFLVVLFGLLILTMINQKVGFKAISVTAYSFKEMILVIPPIFLLLGLLDVWVPKETMIKYMGEGSGFKGVLLSIFIGSAAAGPLYGAFPVAAVFMKKGVSFKNILIFIGAWSTTKIPMFLFEISSLGAKFAVTRLLVDIPGIIIIAYVLSKIVPLNEVKAIYEKAEAIE